MFDIRITDEVDETGLQELRNAVIAFNVAATGYPGGSSLSCLLRNDDGKLVAGLDGFTWGGYAMIEWLWVDDDHRHSGLGTELVKAPEDEAVRRGCAVIRVDTHTFQAPGFYARLGYVQVGYADNTPAGYGELFLQKPLAP